MSTAGRFKRLAAMFAVMVSAAQAAAQIIEIGDFTALRKIGTEAAFPLNGNYALTGNIPMQGLEFQPVGSPAEPFTGTFDGKGYTISNLSISAAPSAGHVGLFGYVGGSATVKNLNVNGSVDGGYNVGVIAGTNHGTIANCYAGGTASASRRQSNAGGLVGSNSGTIERSWSNAAVRGNENIGGLVGILAGGKITQSYAQGQVGNTTTGTTKYAGGLVGYVFGGTAYHCYATGRVTGTDNTGGLIGYDFGSARQWNSAGRSADGSVQKADVTGCFWDIYSTVQTTSAGNLGTGRTTTEMRQIGTFRSAGWDFAETPGAWTIGNGAYPSIRRATTDAPVIPDPDDNDLKTYTLAYNAGSNGRLRIGDNDSRIVTSFDTTLRNIFYGPNITALPNGGYRFTRWSDGVTTRTRRDAATQDISVIAEYEENSFADIPDTAILIYTFEDLCKIGNDPMYPLQGAYYVQMGDIDASASRRMNDGAGFMPIGSSENRFIGIFDGREYTIAGLYINRPANDNGVGLFGEAGGTINGVNVVVDTIIGGIAVGGIAGTFRGSITNSSVSGKIIGSDGRYWAHAGGLVGGFSAGIIRDCYSTADVNGDAMVGGLVGNADGNYTGGNYADRSDIIQCFASGSVNGVSAVGGLVGHKGVGDIIQCSASGSVSGNGYVGGLVGTKRGGGDITQCSASGNINGNGDQVGGLVGASFTGGSITQSFATGDVYGGGRLVGGLIGYYGDYYSGSNITQCFATGNVSGGGNVGGLIGGSMKGVGATEGIGIAQSFVTQSFATGNVSGGETVGGLVGSCGSRITQCFASGSVSGSKNVGGLVGSGNYYFYNFDYYFIGSIAESYSIGRVTIDNSENANTIGGLVGYDSTDDFTNLYNFPKSYRFSVTNSYWDINTSGQSPRTTDWGIGLPSDQMKQRSTYDGWDFVENWAISPTQNSGYPYLRSLGVPVLSKQPEHQPLARAASSVSTAIAKPQVSLKGRSLQVSAPENSNLRIRLVDLRGRTAARFASSGSGRFPLVGVSAGRYIVEVVDVTKKNRVNVSSIILR